MSQQLVIKGKKCSAAETAAAEQSLEIKKIERYLQGGLTNDIEN